MATRTGKYAKRVETLMKAYKLNDKSSITILRFLTQFKRAWASNLVSDGMELLIMSTFIKEGIASSLTACTTPHKRQWNHRLTTDDGRRAGLYICRSCKVLVGILCHGLQYCERNIRYNLHKIGFWRKLQYNLVMLFDRNSYTIETRTQQSVPKDYYWWLISHHLKCGKDVLGSETTCASSEDCPKLRKATRTDRTSAKRCDGFGSKKPFPKRPSSDFRSDCGS